MGSAEIHEMMTAGRVAAASAATTRARSNHLVRTRQRRLHLAPDLQTILPHQYLTS